MVPDQFRLRTLFLVSVFVIAFSCFAIDAMARIKPTVHRPLLAPRVPVIGWSSCPGEVPDLQCSYVPVPLDYNNPDGPQITLALARIPARKSNLRIGSLFINPGGPGGSGVGLLTEGFSTEIDPAVLDRFDIVSWDPRGVGKSTPLLCWASNAARDAYFAQGPVFPYRADQEQAFFTRATNIFGLCVNQGQTIVRHMSTADVARDLDLLRQAVGDNRLNYIGYSYGSYLGQTYANMFPMNVRSLVIDGVLDPVRYSSARVVDMGKTATGEVMQQFVMLCESAGSQCALNGDGGPRLRFQQLLSVLRSGAQIPYNDGQGNITQYTYDKFIEENVGVLHAPEEWRNYAIKLRALSLAASKRNVSRRPLARRKQAQIQLQGWEGLAPDNMTEAFLGSHCADTRYPTSLQQHSQIAQEATATSVQGQYWAWLATACASWSTSQHRYVGPWTVMTAAPVLIVSSYYDAATDYAGAVSSSKLLPNSRLLSYAGWGHSISYTGRSTCTNDYVSLYLIDGSLPPKDTVCPAGPNPFTVTPKAGRSNPLLRISARPFRRTPAIKRNVGVSLPTRLR